MNVVDTGIHLRKFEDGTTDPHYWLHFGNARKIAANIAAALSEIDPAHAGMYRENAKAIAGTEPAGPSIHLASCTLAGNVAPVGPPLPFAVVF